MATFSISDAVVAGFDVIRRRPLSVMAWGLAYFALAVLPSAGLFALVGGDFVELFSQIGRSGGKPDIESFTRLNNTMTLFQPIAFLTAIAARAMLTTAVFRAVLEPKNRGFFYLRFGMDELWQALVYLCFSILFCMALFATLLIGAGLGALSWVVGGLAVEPWASVVRGLGIAMAVLVAVGGLIWVSLRLSLAGPMTFADRTFRLFESWTMTKGQGWRLFGLALLLGLMLFAITLVVGALQWAVILGFGFGVGFAPERIEAFFQQPVETWLMALLPAVAVIAVVGSLITGALYAIVAAPWAAAYRELRGSPQMAEV